MRNQAKARTKEVDYAAAARLALLSAVVALGGCADYGYDRVQMGQRSGDYGRRFAESQTRRGDRTLCWLDEDWAGRADAVVLLLTDTQTVCGKWHATHDPGTSWMGRGVRYRLRGVIDPEPAGFRGAGPIDTLRAVADDLAGVGADEFTRTAYGWVAAGIVRLVQHWPNVGNAGPAEAELVAALARVPGGGQATITIAPDGRIHVEYVYSAD